MERGAVSGIMLIMLLIGMFGLAVNITSVMADKWIPYVPEPWQWWPKEWSLVHWIDGDKISYINFRLVWPDTGYYVSDWGTLTKDDYGLFVNTVMWKSTGYVLPVITYESHTYNLGHLEPGSYHFTFGVSGVLVKSIPFIVRPLGIMATIDVGPGSLNLRSKGQWINAYIQLPEGYNPEDINAATILLNGTISPVLDPKYGFVTNPSGYLVDHNGDAILERMVKFDRSSVELFIYNQGITYGEVSLTISGELFDGTPFGGTDVIFVNYAGDANNDGTIDIADLSLLNAHWDTNNAKTDFNHDGTVNILDKGILSCNWGQSTP